jgi:hypothetical protein
MQESKALSFREPGDAANVALPALASGRLRDADWLPAEAAEDTTAAQRTQLLHRWGLASEQHATGLMFQPLDGNPRHGVLALFVDEGELHGAIEIVERQGRWVVMPDSVRARTLAVAAMVQNGSRMRSSIAGTPDRRFIFFNSAREGGTSTLVERRRDGGVPVA